MTCGRATAGREPAATAPRGPWGALLTLDSPAPIENGGYRVTVDIIARIEWIGAILRDAVAPLAWSGGVIFARDSGNPMEVRGGVALDIANPLETLHGVLLNVDGAAPIEFLTGFVRDTTAPLEIIGTPSLIGDVLRPATPVFVIVPQRPRGS